MTIVVVDHYTAVCDGQATDGERISDRDLRKIISGGTIDGIYRLYAFAGMMAAFQPAIDWFEAGHRASDLPRCPGDRHNDAWTLAVITEAGIRSFNSNLPWADEFRAPFAMGCGRDFAFGALWHGATARQAVELVCANTANCGGEIYEFPLPWAKVAGTSAPLEFDRTPAKQLWPRDSWV